MFRLEVPHATENLPRSAYLRYGSSARRQVDFASLRHALAAIAEGTTHIRNYSTGADCQSTLGAVSALGAAVERQDGDLVIQGRGLEGLTQPLADLDAGNSGSTIRMLSGILAGQKFSSRIFGDESLSRRPMGRIMKPLGEMGAVIGAREGELSAARDHRRDITADRIHAAGPERTGQVLCVAGRPLRRGRDRSARTHPLPRPYRDCAPPDGGRYYRRAAQDYPPGPPCPERVRPCRSIDLSLAAFFIVAALLVPESDLVIQGVGLNPTRSTLLDFLISIGARIKILDVAEVNGELVGDIRITSAPIRGGVIEGEMTASLIDEIPVLAVLGAASENGLVIRDAGELRVKETDRIATVIENFARMGITVEASPDGMVVPGRQRFRAAGFDSYGDHRIAMAFAVASLRGMANRPSRTPIQPPYRFLNFSRFWRRRQALSDIKHGRHVLECVKGPRRLKGPNGRRRRLAASRRRASAGRSFFCQVKRSSGVACDVLSCDHVHDTRRTR